MKPLAICIGYDSREPLALQVLAHSITTRASAPVTIIPVAKRHLVNVYRREDAMATTEFSLTRFLSPWLVNYEGWALFMDCDMLVQVDVYDIFRHVDDAAKCGVYVCQHDYVPKDAPKATGAQVAYPRKNWSSVMLFNATKCRALTPHYVNTATPAQLHRFDWIADEDIGSLPVTWNWLVGEYEKNTTAPILHYTLGTPCFEGYQACDCADLWWAEYKAMHTPMPAYEWPEAERYVRLAAKG